MLFSASRTGEDPIGDADMTYLAEQFPDPANFFPVLRKIFPVNLLRELLEKSLQRSSFQPRNLLPEHQNREFPCKIPF